MTIEQIMGKDEERPLDRYYPANGGFCGIFRTVGCIGDSLASGEFESMDEEGNKGITIILNTPGGSISPGKQAARYTIFPGEV